MSETPREDIEPTPCGQELIKAKAEIKWMNKQRKECKLVLINLLKALHVSDTDCEHLHHNKHEYHTSHEVCPVSKRIDCAIKRAEILLQNL